MGNAYTTYRQSLKELGMDTLERRREILCLRFAKKSLKNEKLKRNMNWLREKKGNMQWERLERQDLKSQQSHLWQNY